MQNTALGHAQIREWVAISRGSLDVVGHAQFVEAAEILVTPTFPASPIALKSDGARLWRRLANGPVLDKELEDHERGMVREMATIGIAADARDHPNRVRGAIPAPWLSSPLHELGYALVQSLANDADVRIVFIKGPTLHAQGLREREHSGDIDVWADADRYELLVNQLTEWGWQPTGFDFPLPTYHSIALRPPDWACEIDVHFRFPGTGNATNEVFAELERMSQTSCFAGVASRVPNASAHAVLYALHLVRPTPGVTAPAGRHNEAAKAIAISGSPTIEAAAALGSIDVLRDLLVQALPNDHVPEVGPGLPQDWMWRLQPNRARYHLAVIRSLPWRDRPRALRLILWPSDQVAQVSASLAGRQPQPANRARMLRIIDGIRQLVRPSRNSHR